MKFIPHMQKFMVNIVKLIEWKQLASFFRTDDITEYPTIGVIWPDMVDFCRPGHQYVFFYETKIMVRIQ